MADPVETPPADLPLAANGEVKAYDRLGNKITVPKEKVGELYGLGGRVAPKAEVLAASTQEAYDKQGLGTKVATVASLAGPVGYPLQAYMRGQGAVLPPQLESYIQGVSTGFTGGAASVGMKELVGEVGGKEAAHAYGQTAQDVVAAHGEMHAAGELAGFIGSAVAGGPKGGLGAAGKAIPGVGISALGGIAEQGAARVLAPVAAKGAIGRALATGGELAARGAVEGSIYSGASEVTEAMLGDRDLAADKVFAAMGTGALYGGAAGGVLGAGGSLAASGARGAAGVVRSGISKALSKAPDVGKAGAGLAAVGDQVASEVRGVAGDVVARGEDAARQGLADTAGDAVASGKGIAEATGTKLEQEAAGYRGALDKASKMETQKGWAYDQAWKAIGAGNGLQSTSFAKSAERYLPNGTKDVGEVLMRKGIINVEDGLLNAARAGTPEALSPKIAAELQVVGSRIGDLTAASPARISGVEIGKAVSDVAGKYEASAATRPVGKSLRAFAESLRDSLGIVDMDSTVAVQDLIRERKALDTMVFENAALDPSLAIQVKRELRTKLEGLVMDGLDAASEKVPGTLKAEYKTLKHDYTALSIASDAADDSAARMAKGATFGLTDTLRGGGSIVKTLGSKVVRERGNAAAAVLLYRMADMGTLTRAIASVDEQVGKAAKGLLAAPKRTPLPEATSSEPLRVRAGRIMDRVAQIQADPERYATAVAAQTEALNGTAPQIAGALTQRLTSAAAFLAARIPVQPDKDPFDPHPAPRLTDSQASALIKYDGYLQRPMRFFEELAHGKLTHEGVEVIREVMPGAFAELQARTVEGIADLMAQGKKPPFAQRERIGVLMHVPATPSQRPEHGRFLQSNVVPFGGAQKPPNGAPAPKRQMPTKSQPSTLDRLEGR